MNDEATKSAFYLLLILVDIIPQGPTFKISATFTLFLNR